MTNETFHLMHQKIVFMLKKAKEVFNEKEIQEVIYLEDLGQYELAVDNMFAIILQSQKHISRELLECIQELYEIFTPCMECVMNTPENMEKALKLIK